jgi:hypothetical protein
VRARIPNCARPFSGEQQLGTGSAAEECEGKGNPSQNARMHSNGECCTCVEPC